jgi:hypothetical protein
LNAWGTTMDNVAELRASGKQVRALLTSIAEGVSDDIEYSVTVKLIECFEDPVL